jgi:hypothetical protein
MSSRLGRSARAYEPSSVLASPAVAWIAGPRQPTETGRTGGLLRLGKRLCSTSADVGTVSVSYFPRAFEGWGSGTGAVTDGAGILATDCWRASSFSVSVATCSESFLVSVC